MMRIVTMVVLIAVVSIATYEPASAQRACKDCTDQYQRCMKNYPGPTCKTERDICTKSCKN
jgi:hypothetical protein